MAKRSAFYSINEVKKPPEKRVHHDNTSCAAGRDIPESERRTGTGGYRLCERCQQLD